MDPQTRGACLQLACDFADNWAEAITIADTFLDYIENGSDGIGLISMMGIKQ